MENELKRYNALELAYLGDAVFELMVREYFLRSLASGVGDLNAHVFKVVKATSQAKATLALQEKLTEEEWGYVKYGRNANKSSLSRNSSAREYRYATGLETLFGAFYLKGDIPRLKEILGMILEVLHEEH